MAIWIEVNGTQLTGWAKGDVAPTDTYFKWDDDTFTPTTAIAAYEYVDDEVSLSIPDTSDDAEEGATIDWIENRGKKIQIRSDWVEPDPLPDE